MIEKFSFYKKGITNKIPSSSISLDRAISLIRGDEYMDDIARLRAADDKTVRGVIKKNLHYFTFSGVFKKRLTDDLQQHSGLICMDFDDIDVREFKPKLSADKYSSACFVSPSGTGLKVIVRIDPTQHLESFKALENYYKETYNLTVDPSGKDVTRACFVSWDPEAYINDEGELFKQKDIEDPTPEGQEAKQIGVRKQMRLAKDLQRAQYVTDQIDRHQLDITGDYDDWRDIGFALSRFGEEGRDLYHRVSRFHPEYSRTEADKKFDDAVKNSRFTTPAKFFSIAKDYGLDVRLPKTIQEAKEENEIKDLVGEENTDEYLKFGIWESNGRYYSLDLRGKKYEVSNFKMRVLNMIESKTMDSWRMIEIKNIHGLTRTVALNTDDFTSVGSFRKEIEKRGNFLFRGGDADLYRLKDKLLRDEKPTTVIDQLGWHKRGRFYAWANGIYDASEDVFIPIDNYGIVEHDQLTKDGDKKRHNYFIPALSSIYSEREDVFSNDKKFIYMESKNDFKTWAEQYCKVYGKPGQIALIFFIMALFSDIIFRDMNKRFPILNVYGKRGTGKGTLIASLMRMFGEGQEQIMLGGASTVVGFMRKLGQFSNSMVWLDEYKNNLVGKIIESLKNIYDRIGYERGKKDNTFQTESTPIRSACVLSGQEMPTIEPALFTRVVLISLTETKYTDEQRTNFRKLQRMENAGLSGITVGLLKHRAWFDQHFRKTFESEQKALMTEVNNNEIDERMFINYAAFIATCELIGAKEQLPFNSIIFKEQCRKNLQDQFYVLKGSDDSSKFWDVVEQLFYEERISEGRHFLLRNGYLYIRIQEVYQYYAEALQRRKDPNVLDKSTLEKYLESDSKSFVSKHKKFFGGAQKWCMQFIYKEIGVDLIRVSGDSKEELRSKYLEMGIDLEEENTPGNLSNKEELPF